MKSICVFCASGIGKHPVYGETAFELGSQLASLGIEVIYGGAKVGVMGKLADGALSNNGKVVGIIPDFLKKKEIAHSGLTELISVSTMHERKALMQQKSDGFIALPGGFGTMEELFEILTWAQLGLHKKPIGILNVKHFYDPLIQLIETMVKEGLLKEEYKKILIISQTVDDLIEKMNSFKIDFKPVLDADKIM